MMAEDELREIWRRSEEGEDTKWSFHEDGTVTSSIVNTEESQEIGDSGTSANVEIEEIDNGESGGEGGKEKGKEKEKGKGKEKTKSKEVKSEMLPAAGITKNGTRVTLKSGTYLMYNSEWLKLSGRLVDANSYFNIAGDMPPLGRPPAMIDSAILDKMLGDHINNGIGAKGLALGWIGESLGTWSIGSFTANVLYLGFIFNMVDGYLGQIEINKKHDKDTVPQKPN